MNELDEQIKTVDINGLKYEVSGDEFQFLIKLPEEERLFGLALLRFNFHVLSKQGKKKPNTMTLIASKSALRFMAEFVKHGLRGSNGRVEATDVRAVQKSLAIAKDQGDDNQSSVPTSTD